MTFSPSILRTRASTTTGKPRSRGGLIRAGLLIGLALIALGGVGCASTPYVDPEQQAVDLRIALAKRNVGVDHLANGRTPLAIRELQFSYELNPDDARTVLWLGEAYRRRGLLDKALDYMVLAREMDPEDHDLLLNLTGLYVQLKRFPEAIEVSQVLIDDPTFPAPWQAYTNLGWAQLQLGHTPEARASFEEALAFQPRYWPARLNLGILDARQGRRLQAIVNFEKVLERNIGRRVEAETNYRLGEAYVAMGRRDKALEYFKLAAEKAPYERWGEQSQEYLKLLH